MELIFTSCPISCEEEMPKLATRLHPAGPPFRRFGTSAGIPGGCAPTDPAGCSRAFLNRSDVVDDVVAACHEGGNCLLPASLWKCCRGWHWSLRACPWTDRKWVTFESGPQNIREGLGLPRNLAAPFSVGVVVGAYVGGARVGLPVALAPWLARPASSPPEKYCREERHQQGVK